MCTIKPLPEFTEWLDGLTDATMRDDARRGRGEDQALGTRPDGRR
ncbi:hypothetical protein ACQUJS_17565 [Ralstonia pseudosolanacearum]|uniref:Uncharacterized protein n=1 Tax=Ralstonia solanacearum TaxID=305 RepID=A0A0S4TUI5_RALSL|nr:protein of unknown function [Ralstonia solanacearum]